MYALANSKHAKSAGDGAQHDGDVSFFCSHAEFGRRPFRSWFSKTAQVVPLSRHTYRIDDFHFVSRTRRKDRET